MNYDNDGAATVSTVKSALNKGLNGILKASFDEVLDLQVDGDNFHLTAKNNNDLSATIAIKDAGHTVKMHYEDPRTTADYVVQKGGADGSTIIATGNVCRDAARFGAHVALKCST
jgi:hypothetical protein